MYTCETTSSEADATAVTPDLPGPFPSLLPSLAAPELRGLLRVAGDEFSFSRILPELNPAAQVFVVVIISVRLLALSGIPVGRVGVGVAVVGCIAEQVSSVWLHFPCRWTVGWSQL